MSDATIPAVVPDAQQYDGREDLDSIEACEEVWECAYGCCNNRIPRHNDECIRLAAYIERLESEVERSHDAILALTGTVERLEAERDALLAEQTFVDIVFDGPPSRESGRFIEVENMSGASVGIGEWVDRGNGYWALRIPTTTPRG